MLIVQDFGLPKVYISLIFSLPGAIIFTDFFDVHTIQADGRASTLCEFTRDIYSVPVSLKSFENLVLKCD